MEIDKNQQKKKGLAIKIMKSLNSGLKLLLKFSARQNTVLTPRKHDFLNKKGGKKRKRKKRRGK